MVVSASRLGNELPSQTVNKNWSVPTPDVIVTQLSVVVKAAREHLPVQSDKDTMMKTTCCLNNLPCRQTSNDLRGDLMTRMFLAKLPVVVPANRVHLSLSPAADRLVDTVRASLCGDDDRVIVAARHIEDERVPQSIDKSGS